MPHKEKIIGRPPKLFSKEQCVELGKDLIEWIKGEGANGTQFVRWYWDKHFMFKKDWKELKQRESFRPYYEMAQQKMAENISLNNKIAQSYGNRYLCYYDPDLLEHEEAKKDRQAKRDQKDKIEISLEDWEKFKAIQKFLVTETQPSENKEDEENHNC
jgi:hypothetical protein